MGRQGVDQSGIGPAQETELEVAVIELVEVFDPKSLVIAVNQLRVQQVVLILLG